MGVGDVDVSCFQHLLEQFLIEFEFNHYLPVGFKLKVRCQRIGWNQHPAHSE